MSQRPANEDGMRVNVLTGELYIIPKEEWKKKIRKVVMIDYDNYLIIKKALYGPCIVDKCKQSLDLISKYFEKLDKAVGQLPTGK